MLRTQTKCPNCGRPVNGRITPWLRRMMLGFPPDLVIGDHECTKRTCKTVFPIRAGDWAAAQSESS
jgi:hypothetical protein